MIECCVVVMAKRPVEGKVKTRIAKDVGHQKAIQIYQELLNITKTTLDKTSLAVSIYQDDLEELIWPKGKNYNFFKQTQGHLGARMLNAIENELKKFNKVLLIGADCPYLSEAHLMEAIKILSHKDSVIGPAQDGGYYLIGFKSMPSSDVFNSVKWSSETVFTKTLENLSNLNLTVGLLDMLKDIDEIEDWREYKKCHSNLNLNGN